MKSSTLRSINTAFGRGDEDRLALLAKAAGTTPALWLRDTVNRVHGRLMEEIARLQAAEIETKIDEAVLQGDPVSEPTLELEIERRR